MAIAQVGNWTAAQFNNVSTGTNTARTSTTGNFIACGITLNNNSLFSNLTTTSNSLTQRSPVSGWQSTGGDSIRLYSAHNITGASQSMTLTTSSNAFFVICATEYSGLATGTPFDKQASSGASGSGTSFDTGATATTTQANELIVCYGDQDAGGTGTGAFSAGASFNVRTSITAASSGSTGCLEDRIVAATGAYHGLMSTSGFNTPSGWDACVATFADTNIGGGSFNPGWTNGATRGVLGNGVF